jgi:hypothetical protein
MCFINTCSKMNDQCAIVLVQVCAALSFLGCFECCSQLCCGGGGGSDWRPHTGVAVCCPVMCIVLLYRMHITYLYSLSGKASLVNIG